MKKTGLIITAILVGIAIIVAIIGVSASNKEIRIRSQITAQTEVCQASFDNMFKIIAQRAQVATEAKNAFKDIYVSIMEGRYGDAKGGSLIKFIQESNPNFDISLYKDLSNSIEAERKSFFFEQKKLIDLNNEHRNIRNTFPGSIFIGSRPDIKITIITSAKTKAVYEDGEENDVKLFDSTKK